MGMRQKKCPICKKRRPFDDAQRDLRDWHRLPERYVRWAKVGRWTCGHCERKLDDGVN